MKKLPEGFQQHIKRIKALPEVDKAKIRGQLFKNLGLKPIPSGTLPSVEVGIHRDNKLAVDKAEGAYQQPKPAQLAPDKSYTPAKSPVQLASAGLGGLPPVKTKDAVKAFNDPEALQTKPLI